MSMHSRKFLRIEGDLATLVTEVTEREVALDDLLSRLAEQRSAISGMLPAGCRFWVRSPEGREAFVVEQLPMRRQIEYHASNRYGSEPVIHRIALPYVVFVVSTAAGHIESLSHFFRTSASRSRRDPMAGLSAQYDRYWRNLRQVVAAAAGMSPEDLPGGRANSEQLQATVETPAP